MGTGFQNILPAPSQRTTTTSETSSAPLVKKKRSGVSVACNRCRARKTTCDGHRPRCHRCSQRGDSCTYATTKPEETRQRVVLARELAQLRDQLKQHEDILQHLHSAPEEEALATILCLRSTPNVGAVLTSIRHSVSPKRPPEQDAARATLPFIQSSLELELTVLHGNVYPALSKIDTSAIDIDSVFRKRTSCVLPHISTNALIESYKTFPIEPTRNLTESLICGPPSPLRGTNSCYESPVSGPLPGRVYCDARLRDVCFQYWTRVPVSDEYAASLLSVYLENEHATVGTFDVQTFLDDLVEGRGDFCSSFLVSSILCLASLCFSSFDQRALPLATAFLSEAEGLWQAERCSDSATNISAMTTLGVATMMNGKEEVSLELFADSRYMAERMCLIGVRHTHPLSDQFRKLPPDELRAYSQAAWGCYSWLSIHASYFTGNPIPFPPVLPIPGLSVAANPGGWPTHPQPEYLGHSFPAWCRLWTIAQEIQALYHRKHQVPLHDAIPYAFAESKYRKLLCWAKNLEQGALRKNQRFPHVSVLHAYFHIIVLDLFRPFLEVQNPLRLKSFSLQDSSPQTVFDASLMQLQRILLDYTTTYDPRFYNFILNGAVLHILHLTLQRNRDKHGWRFNLALGFGWMKEIFVRFAVIGKVAQAYMAIGMDTGVISSSEAREFMQNLQHRGRSHDLARVAVSCVVDFERAMSSKEDFRAQDVARKFEELALFDDIIIDCPEE